MTRGTDVSIGRLIAVDWGTSRLRATLVDDKGGAVADAESGDGIGTIEGSHEAAFGQLVAGWPHVPAVIAGMAGSRQGWREAPYIPCPAPVMTLAESLLRFKADDGRSIAIVPGIMLRTPERDGDVMRGEETQIAGLVDSEPGFSGTVILPGTHSKWARVTDGSIIDFQTFLSGEMFDLLARRSFLRHSVAENGGDLAGSPDFALAIERVTEKGLPFLAAIFSVRARQLLDGVKPRDNLAYLSGLVIGGEIAAAKNTGRLSNNTALRVVGSESLASAYRKAFALLGHEVKVYEGRDLAVGGLLHLARASGFAEIGGQP